MNPADVSVEDDVEARARRSGGVSTDAVYALAAEVLRQGAITGGRLLDVGCGRGAFRSYAENLGLRYAGVDVVRYDDWPEEVKFVQADLQRDRIPLPDECVEVVLCLETVEHVENPRRLFRELARLAKPGGAILVSTPNQLSLLSLGTLLCKHRFNAFQDVHYPAHLSALLEVDLLRMAAENGLENIRVVYTGRGRLPFTAWDWPRWLGRFAPRGFSDNLLLAARKPSAGPSL